MPEGVGAMMRKRGTDDAQAASDDQEDRGPVDRPQGSAVREEQLAPWRPWTHFLEVADQGCGNGGRQGEGLRSQRLGACHREHFSVPVEVIQAKPDDLTGTKAVDGQQQQQRAVSDIDRPIPTNQGEHLPDLVPGRPGGKAGLGEDPRSLDARRQARAAQAGDLGVAEEAAQVAGIVFYRRTLVALGRDERHEGFVDLREGDFAEGKAG